MGKKENTKSKYTGEKIKIELTQYDGEPGPKERESKIPRRVHDK